MIVDIYFFRIFDSSEIVLEIEWQGCRQDRRKG